MQNANEPELQSQQMQAKPLDESDTESVNDIFDTERRSQGLVNEGHGASLAKLRSIGSIPKKHIKKMA